MTFRPETWVKAVPDPTEGVPGRLVTAELLAVTTLVLTQAVVALLRVDAPFTEPAAYGRSCVNATIARNFFEHGMRLLYPQLDYGSPPGYAALEFPLIPYLAAAMYWVTGIQEWVGRGIPALFGIGTTIVVWLIARELTPNPLARVAAVTLMVLSPTFEFFSRVFQSDSAMVFFIVLSVLLLMRAERSGSQRTFTAACIACIVGMLLKPSSLVLLPALVSIPVLSGKRRTIAPAVVLIGTTLVIVAGYYLFARAVNTYPETLGLDAVARRATLQRMLQVSYDLQIAKDIVQAVTPAGIVSLAAGLLLGLRRRQTWFLPLWAAGAIVLNLVFNEALSHHEYYQLIWVPLAALSAAELVSAASETRWLGGAAQWAVAAVAVAILAGSVTLTWRFLALRLAFPPSSGERLTAAALVEQHTPPNALVAVEDIDLLYYSHRRGWPFGTDTGQPISVIQLQGVAARGVEYLMIADARRTLSDEGRRYLDQHGMVVARGDRAVLWDLTRN
jgi:hypothetical protein